MSNPIISQITLPSGTTYDIADIAAREAASHGLELVKSTDAASTPYGVTWKSGSTTITGTLAAASTTCGKMYLVPIDTEETKDIYSEWITVTGGTSGSPTYSWEKIGTTDIDLSDLGALAYKDSASGSYTPAGSVSGGAFTGSSTTFTGNFTPQGSIAVNAASGSGTSYTPEGSVSAPTISVSSAGATTSITPFGSQGTLPSLTTTVSDGNLTISFSQGTLPTAGTAVDVKTGDASYTATAPSFTGTEKKFAFSGTQGSVSTSGTPNGSNGAITFSGTAATITVS